jgi:hypothetical protein
MSLGLMFVKNYKIIFHGVHIDWSDCLLQRVSVRRGSAEYPFSH